MSLKVRYNKEVDILTADTGLEKATSSSVDFGLIADYGSEEGYDVVGIELMSAGKLIAPFCAINSKDFLASKEAAFKLKPLGGVVKRVYSRPSWPGVGRRPSKTPFSWHSGLLPRATA